MTPRRGNALAVLGRAVYWILLTGLLLVLPVLQAWEALPEGGLWRLAKIAVPLAVAAIVLATRRRRTLHLAAVAGLLGAGLLLFAWNQGLVHRPASAADVRILLRTKALLATPEVWDRSASRDCPENPSSTFTLYCALRRASLNETGGFRHRGAALQIVRAEIETLRPQAGYEHRLSGFNSDPGVTFADLTRLLDGALARARADVSAASSR